VLGRVVSFNNVGWARSGKERWAHVHIWASDVACSLPSTQTSSFRITINYYYHYCYLEIIEEQVIVGQTENKLFHSKTK